jgi:putative phage-type endonuclease
MPFIKVLSTEHWHQLRAQHVGASEVGALFGEHAHTTLFELWHQKAKTLPAPDLSDNERVQFGLIMEPAIAEAARRKTGWTIRKVHRYYTMRPECRAGASLDYEILGHPKGPGLLEIKTADWLVAKRWGDGVPIHYELQVQHGLMCCGRQWGVIALLVGGNDLRIFPYEARPKTAELIQRRIDLFWASIEANEPPAPDFGRDHDAIAALHRDASPGKVVDLSDSNRLPELLAEYEHATAERRQYERAAKVLRAEILMTLGDAELAICGEWTIKASTVAGTPDRVVTAEMIGERIRGREGYRGLHVSRRKEEAA